MTKYFEKKDGVVIVIVVGTGHTENVYDKSFTLKRLKDSYIIRFWRHNIGDEDKF